jgi:hypothetical protein
MDRDYAFRATISRSFGEGEICAANRAACCFFVIARSEATKQSILSLCGEMDCFAPLAMTAEGGLT